MFRRKIFRNSTENNYIKIGQIATIDSNWGIIPDNTSNYRIYSTSIYITGTSQGGNSSTTIILSVNDTQNDDYYKDMIIKITNGTGVEQIRTITNYIKMGQIATISTNWTTIPDNTSVYKIYVFNIFNCLKFYILCI